MVPLSELQSKEASRIRRKRVLDTLSETFKRMATFACMNVDTKRGLDRDINLEILSI